MMEGSDAMRHFNLGATETAGQIRRKSKAAEHSRTPKPVGFKGVTKTPRGFGVRLCSAALARKSQPGKTVLTRNLRSESRGFFQKLKVAAFRQVCASGFLLRCIRNGKILCGVSCSKLCLTQIPG